MKTAGLVRARNLQNCLAGYRDCKKSLLSDSERVEVAEAIHFQNWKTCLDGLGDCEQSQLNAQEQREVREARYYRNLQGCLGAVGQCDTSQLSDAVRLGGCARRPRPQPSGLLKRV